LAPPIAEKSSGRGPLEALCIYAIFTVAAVWPHILHLSTRLIGSIDEDLYKAVWGIWSFRHYLLETGRFPYAVDILNYPRGGVFCSLNPLESIAAVPVGELVGTVAACNLVIVFHLLFGAMSAYFLARRMTGSHYGALLAGTLYGFSSLILSGVYEGLVEVYASGWLPLFLLLFLGCLGASGRSRRLSALGAGAALWALLLSNSYYAVVALVAAAFLALFHVQGTPLRTRLAVGLLVVAAAGLAASPFYYFHGCAMRDPHCLINVKNERVTGQVYANPHYAGSRCDIAGIFFYVKQGAPSQATSAPRLRSHIGMVPLVLALLAAWFRRSLTIYVWEAFVFILLFSGPFLCVNGEFPTLLGHHIPMPAYLFKYVPVLKMATSFHRFHIGGILFLALGAGTGLAFLLADAGKVKARLATLVLCTYALIYYLAYSPLPYPLPALTFEPPGFYRTLSSGRDSYGIIDLPIALGGEEIHPAWKRMYVLYQTEHGKGIVYDLKDRMLFSLRGNALVKEIMHAEREMGPAPPRREYGPAVTELAAQGFRYIVLHTAYYTPDRLAEVMRFLGRTLGEPVAVGVLVVYRVTVTPGGAPGGGRR